MDLMEQRFLDLIFEVLEYKLSHSDKVSNSVYMNLLCLPTLQGILSENNSLPSRTPPLTPQTSIYGDRWRQAYYSALPPFWGVPPPDFIYVKKHIICLLSLKHVVFPYPRMPLPPDSFISKIAFDDTHTSGSSGSGTGMRLSTLPSRCTPFSLMIATIT